MEESSDEKKTPKHRKEEEEEKARQEAQEKLRQEVPFASSIPSLCLCYWFERMSHCPVQAEFWAGVDDVALDEEEVPAGQPLPPTPLKSPSAATSPRYAHSACIASRS